jgi:hypothetical protein
MTTVAQSNVFNQFTFFSVLFPGLFAVGFTLPLAPASITEISLGWTVLLLIGFSFGLGMTLNVASEVVVKWTDSLTFAGDRFYEVIRGINVSETESNIVGIFAERAAEIGIIDDSESIDELESRDSKILYQYMLNQVWSQGDVVTRTHLSIRMMCRSLMIYCIFAIPFTIILVGAFWYYGSTGILYYKLMSHSTFLLIVIPTLCISALIFGYGQRRYAEYLIWYTLSEFVREEQSE